MDTVRIVTDKGEWGVTVRGDSEAFAPLIEPYLELGEGLPQRIVVGGSVAEVIEQGWPAYESLMRFIQDAGQPSNYATSEEVHYDTPLYLTLVAAGGGGPRQFSLPFYSELSRLSRIINLPKGWEKYTIVTEDDPMTERLDHLMASGRATVEVRKKVPASEYTGRYRYGLRSAMDTLGLMAMDENAHTIGKYPGIDTSGLVRDAFYGITRNAILTAYQRNHNKVEWEDVLWSDIRRLIEREIGPQDDWTALFTADLLGGTASVGPVDRHTYVPSYIFSHRGLYNNVLRALPEDVSPIDLGLGDAMGLSDYWSGDSKPVNLTTLLLYVKAQNRGIIAGFVDYSRRRSESHENLDVLISDLEREGGTYALHRILVSIIYYNEGHPDTRAWAQLAAAIEKRLAQ